MPPGHGLCPRGISGPVLPVYIAGNGGNAPRVLPAARRGARKVPTLRDPAQGLPLVAGTSSSQAIGSRRRGAVPSKRHPDHEADHVASVPARFEWHRPLAGYASQALVHAGEPDPDAGRARRMAGTGAPARHYLGGSTPRWWPGSNGTARWRPPGRTITPACSMRWRGRGWRRGLAAGCWWWTVIHASRPSWSTPAQRRTGPGNGWVPRRSRPDGPGVTTTSSRRPACSSTAWTTWTSAPRAR